jgi:mannitol/fructose-specific phosphotransferase system IIA component (Ntr-type)
LLWLDWEGENNNPNSLDPIPHIIVDGQNIYALLLARCRGGIRFSDMAPSVQAVFVLAGSPNEWNFHLRALMAIAQIVQEDDFESKWLGARNREALRDLILLGQRKRHPA